MALAVVSTACEYAILDGGVGLSGVGYGLFGMLFVLSRRDPRYLGVVDPPTVTMFVAWFFLCIAFTLLDWMPVANIAHGAGAAAGALVGAAMATRLPRRARVGAVAGLVVFAAASLLGATVLRPAVNLSPRRGAQEAYLGFVALENRRDADAARWLEASTALRPDDADAWHNLGVAYARLGRRGDANAAFAREQRLRAGKPPR